MFFPLLVVTCEKYGWTIFFITSFFLLHLIDFLDEFVEEPLCILAFVVRKSPRLFRRATTGAFRTILCWIAGSAKTTGITTWFSVNLTFIPVTVTYKLFAAKLRLFKNFLIEDSRHKTFERYDRNSLGVSLIQERYPDERELDVSGDPGEAEESFSMSELSEHGHTHYERSKEFRDLHSSCTDFGMTGDPPATDRRLVKFQSRIIPESCLKRLKIMSLDVNCGLKAALQPNCSQGAILPRVETFCTAPESTQSCPNVVGVDISPRPVTLKTKTAILPEEDVFVALQCLAGTLKAIVYKVSLPIIIGIGNLGSTWP